MGKRFNNKGLRKFILDEVAKLQEAGMSGDLEDVSKVEAEEVEASEYASALEQDLDFMKALKIQEERLVKKLRKIEEAKQKLRTRLLRGLDKE